MEKNNSGSLVKQTPDTNEFNKPLSTNLEYLEERARLRFQLYGFAETCMKREKVLFCLLALKEAELLDKETVKENLLQFGRENSSYYGLIEEFIS